MRVHRRTLLVIPPLVLLALVAWWALQPAPPLESTLEKAIAAKRAAKAAPSALTRPPRLPAPPTLGLTPREPAAAADNLVDTAEPTVARVWLYAPRSDGTTAALTDPDVIFTIGCPWQPSPREPELILVHAPTVCSFSASRRDGAFFLRSETVKFDLAPGQELDVHLKLPEGRAGGIGVGFRMTGDGARVMNVHPGSPAALAGLERGDVIVAIEGLPAAGMDQWTFVRHVTGLAGTDVHLTIAERPERPGAETELVDIVFDRVPIESTNW